MNPRGPLKKKKQKEVIFVVVKSVIKNGVDCRGRMEVKKEKLPSFKKKGEKKGPSFPSKKIQSKKGRSSHEEV